MTKGNSVVVGIVANPRHSRARELAGQLITWLENAAIKYCLNEELSEMGLIDGSLAEKFARREDIAERCDPVVVIGGDGTLISVARHSGDKPISIVGVNVGTLGFLTEITPEELFPTLEKVLAGTAQVETRHLFEARVKREGSVVTSFMSVNDVVVTKEAIARLFNLELFVNEKLAGVLRGDGVIIATPGGSTAYSLAAGGPIVHPQVKAFLVTPICPHSLTSRPLVLPDNFTVTLKISSATATGSADVYLTIDGQDGMVILEGDEVIVSRSTKSAMFVKSPSHHYFEILAEKLKWAMR